MTKPLEVIDPVTGFKCYTKHPDKLIARRRARLELDRLVIVAKRLHLSDGNPTYWNGCDTRPLAMHKPGENVVFPKWYRW